MLTLLAKFFPFRT